MSKADKIYKDLYEEIMSEGDLRPETRMYWKDGTKAYFQSIVGKTIVFRPEDGLPALTSKFVPFKSLTQEMLWIWQKRSNVVQDLRDMGSKVWDEWELEDGTIGKAYGYQMENKRYKVPSSQLSEKSWIALGMDKLYPVSMEEFKSDVSTLHLNQVDYIIQQLIDNPYSRHLITMLWNIDDIPEMSLPPCVYETQWIVFKGKLELIVGQRSVDTFLGSPYNVCQYAVLHRIIAKITGYEIGNMTFNMGDVHLYDRHFESAKEFISNEEFEAPELFIGDITTFDDIVFGENLYLVDYKNGVGNAGSIKNEVSITKAELDRLNGK